MFIHEPSKRQARVAIKVPVPIRLHLRLQDMQSRDGREPSKVVAEALERYFARVAASAGTRR